MREFRIFLEELCCDLMRFHFVKRHNIAPEDVDVRQEVNLGTPNRFVNTPQFGTITEASTPGREIQLGVRVSF